jgi:hypothetical protein
LAGRTGRPRGATSGRCPPARPAPRDLRRVLALLEHPQRPPADGFVVLGVGLHSRVRSCCTTGRTSAWLTVRPLAVRGREGGSKMAESAGEPGRTGWNTRPQGMTDMFFPNGPGHATSTPPSGSAARAWSGPRPWPFCGLRELREQRDAFPPNRDRATLPVPGAQNSPQTPPEPSWNERTAPKGGPPAQQCVDSPRQPRPPNISRDLGRETPQPQAGCRSALDGKMGRPPLRAAFPAFRSDYRTPNRCCRTAGSAGCGWSACTASSRP